MSADREEILSRIDAKYQAINQNPDVHLEGLSWSNPITYWDYILPEALLGLQIQRTDQPDEMVFIMYHQINELLFKMILWEIDQVSNRSEITADFFSQKLMRISRYFDMLSSSFTIMGDGMETEQYMKFRNTLTPASGFQSAQYRLIEFASTEIINLIDFRFNYFIYLLPITLFFGLIGKSKTWRYYSIFFIAYLIGISIVQTRIHWYDMPLLPLASIVLVLGLYYLFERFKNNIFHYFLFIP